MLNDCVPRTFLARINSAKTRLQQICCYLLAILVSFIMHTTAAHADWQQTLTAAKGQSVYFNAWGGGDNINQYIQWVAKQVDQQYGITLKHVKLADTADAVSRLIAEKSAGRDDDGSIDLMWINGENFRALKDQKLIYGPFSQNLPNYRYVDESARQSLTLDFGTAVEGMESPWGMSQVVFIYDTQTLSAPPTSMLELLEYAQQNPGRITYPEPPQYLGTTFLKQALYELIADPSVLSEPVENIDFELLSKPLWDYLDQLHPVTWRSGDVFPASAEAMIRLLDDQEIDISLSFDVSSASVQIEQGNLADTVRSYVFDKGTISNTHFVAIPYNSASKAASQVVANFLLSPQAQVKKQTPTVWGDLTVLSHDRLSAQQQQQFAQLPRGIATLSLEQLGQSIPEPDTSWVAALESAWRARYAK
jgi:putative thiamine transport system substrate-binding protein